MKLCELDPTKRCDQCGDCETCDLDPFKKCDDCCKCLDEADYAGVTIERIIIDDKLQPKGLLH